MSLTIVGSDLHVPHEDKAALRKFIGRIETRKPDNVVINGDTFDMYQISRFDKDPSRIPDTQSDIDKGIKALKRIRAAMKPNAKLYVVEGNHEARLTTFLCSPGAAALKSIRGLEAVELFKLNDPDLKAIWVPYKSSISIQGNKVLHGHIVRKRSGFTGHGYMDLYAQSGTSGHTHRLGVVYRTMGDRVISWAESGCLCKLNPEYMHDGTTDWQHGYIEIENGVMRALPL